MIKFLIDGCILFRKDRPARRGDGAALRAREQLECIELCLVVVVMAWSEEHVENLLIRIKRQANISDADVGVYYRPPGQEEEFS